MTEQTPKKSEKSEKFRQERRERNFKKLENAPDIQANSETIGVFKPEKLERKTMKFIGRKFLPGNKSCVFQVAVKDVLPDYEGEKSWCLTKPIGMGGFEINDEKKTVVVTKPIFDAIYSYVQLFVNKDV